jgi:hypothetical protein
MTCQSSVNRGALRRLLFLEERIQLGSRSFVSIRRRWWRALYVARDGQAIAIVF